jgi:hypothetical protein
MRALRVVVFPVEAAFMIGLGLGLSLLAGAQGLYWEVEPALSRMLDRLEGRRCPRCIVVEERAGRR